MTAAKPTPAASLTVRSFAFVRSALLEKREIALIDVREEADHARSHPLFAANLPLSRIETDAWTLLPRRSVPVVLVDADGRAGGLAERALHLFTALGYSDVALLEGGSAGWGKAGGELFCDVNVPSKAFGELVEHVRKTPSLPAEEVQALLKSGANIFIADARRFDEYQTMSIPGGVSVPGGELALRIRDLAPDPQTLVIVNCAGRTRSLIGTQSLINAGIPNPVAALRNGTIGWTLAGLQLEHGQSRRSGTASETSRRQAADAAAHLARIAGVKTVSLETVRCWLGGNETAVGKTENETPSEAAGDKLSAAATAGQPLLPAGPQLAGKSPAARPASALRPASAAPPVSALRTTYCFDVRTPEEFAAGHVSGFRSVAGGQLVQETEMVAPVRGARIVLSDSDGVRAPMAASWLAQMGWDVYTLSPLGEEMFSETGAAPLLRPPLPACAFISAAELAGLSGCGLAGFAASGNGGLAESGNAGLAGNGNAGLVESENAGFAGGGNGDASPIVILDFATEAEHRRGHLPTARYILRSRLVEDLAAAVGGAQQIVLTSTDGALAAYVAGEVATLCGGRDVYVLAGGTAGWAGAGYALAAGLEHPASVPSDRYRRPYEGTDNPRAAMAAYLEWEYGLVAQLGRDGTHGFYVI